jgi:hypothetical protein
MAFLQSDLPPSTAPAKAAVLSPVAPRIATPILRKPARPQRRALPRFAALLAGGLVLIGLGYLAARETESLAMGILAGDLAFLVAVAGWSSIAGGERRR